MASLSRKCVVSRWILPISSNRRLYKRPRDFNYAHITSNRHLSYKSFEPKLPLPDKDKEQELGRYQTNMTSLYQGGNYRKALEAAQKLLEDTEKHFDKHPATAAAYNNVGIMHKALGNYDDARKAYQQALNLYKETLGVDHASTASALHNLGTLSRQQVHLDESLHATQRLTLLEESLSQLEQAYEIRMAELGEQHPHTVASRFSWGAALAAQLLHYYKATTSDQETKRKYLSMRPQKTSPGGWDAAEDHLRQALDTAIQNPRGPRLKQKGKTKRKKGPVEPNTMQTLSAASAGQSLAIFLKARATTTTTDNALREAMLQEAQDLYETVLFVRAQLLPATHSDLYATKYSLAELLEERGEKEKAQVMRQEIVDTYADENDDVVVEETEIGEPADERVTRKV